MLQSLFGAFVPERRIMSEITITFHQNVDLEVRLIAGQAVELCLVEKTQANKHLLATRQIQSTEISSICQLDKLLPA